jgi:hypothetical protein
MKQSCELGIDGGDYMTVSEPSLQRKIERTSLEDK